MTANNTKLNDNYDNKMTTTISIKNDDNDDGNKDDDDKTKLQ